MPTKALASPINTLSLIDDVDTGEVSEHVLVSYRFNGLVTREGVLSNLDQFGPVNSSQINLGIEGQRMILLLDLRNPSDGSASWVLTTRRHSAELFEIYDISSEERVSLIGDDRPRQDALNIRRFIGFGSVLLFEPGETKLLAMEMVLENTSTVPIQIYSHSTFLDEYLAQNGKFIAILSAMAVILLINIVLFVLRKQYWYLYLIAAEIFLFVLIAHSVNFVDAFGMAAFPQTSLLIAELAKCLFTIFMAQFARVFLDTRTTLPIFEKALLAIIAIGLAFVALWLVSPFLGTSMRTTLRPLTWAFVCLSALVFPIAAWRAIAIHGRPAIPLLIGWSGFAFFGGYVFLMAVVFRGNGAPYAVTIMGFAGLTESFFVTLSLAWRIVSDERRHSELLVEQAQKLRDQALLRDRNARLKEDKAMAAATIRDQNAMLNASGHDTKQALLAINNATHYLEAREEVGDTALVDTLKASAAFLDDVLSTTLLAKGGHAESRNCVALQAFRADSLMMSLERIYRPLFVKRGLQFKIDVDPNIHLLSDRALLTRVVSNFMANSLQHTVSGGLYCSIQLERGRAVILVRDTGSGIEPDLLKHLLQEMPETLPTSAVQSGMGSGFKIARELIVQMAGELVVDSAIGSGTEVRITLLGTDTAPTAISTEQFKPQVGVVVHDLDAVAIDQLKSNAASIGVTFDVSSTMRARAAAKIGLLVYKPLFAELLQHPLLIGSRSSQSL